ncbi:PDDEXK nuclease domain-containing protein [Thiopseudomonas acetoxidans]|uniref:PDDEXK nuclease domain-containing protein n=1 Tax=Thiopseudomonas acetoxidans TaxID=3041622 RepID=A0ABT7SRL8_9GAMM|nr:PDDEXK nuclease domain-containing protein [Thiopseudomonas sp. CY1220]MDM7858834.1 PDDEXK nuclease domain-containing protein [Thiopseudomonas sp. CY1220]
MLQHSSDYLDWLNNIKQRVVAARMRVALAANSELIRFYWELGSQIDEKQQYSQWGDKIIQQLSADLQKEFPEIKGFSTTNLKYCLRFYQFFAELQPSPFGQQPVDQIPWGHNIQIFTKCTSLEEASFYISQTLEQGWSRDVLALQLKSRLHERAGKTISNFSRTLPAPQSDLAQQTLKDPYIFDFMQLTTSFNERDVEQQLTRHLTQFLLELGKGFAFVGRQYHLEIADNDYYLDLLFYHITLKCYVVIELKNKKFIPEYAGKLNFYLSAVDSLLKKDDDQPSIGLLLCRDKSNIEVEFALRDMNKPMGVSEYNLVESLPDNLKGALPTVEEIERDLLQMQEDNLASNSLSRR